MKNTIKSTTEISLLFATAQRINTGHLIALIADVQERRDRNGRVAFIAGKKLGTAPQRNKAKRLMREAARAMKAPWPNKDIIFLAKPPIVSTDLASVIKDMGTIKHETYKPSKRQPHTR